MMSYGMVDPREIRARLDTPAVRIFMQRGYTIDLIKEVIEEKLRTTGNLIYIYFYYILKS